MNEQLPAVFARRAYICASRHLRRILHDPLDLGSMEFACKLAGAKVVLVMGHTSCGATKGAIDNAELGNLTGLLAKIKPAVEATAYTGERTSKNYQFVDAVARNNVEITMTNIRKDSPVLNEMESNGAIKMAGAMYNLETGVVDFFEG
jgi:carbonic anhydrase